MRTVLIIYIRVFHMYSYLENKYYLYILNLHQKRDFFMPIMIKVSYTDIPSWILIIEDSVLLFWAE